MSVCLRVTCSAVKKSRQSRVNIIRACTSRINWLNCHVKQKQKVATNTSHSTTLCGNTHVLFRAYCTDTQTMKNIQDFFPQNFYNEIFFSEELYVRKVIILYWEHILRENKYVLSRVNISYIHWQLLTTISYFIKVSLTAANRDKCFSKLYCHMLPHS